ncbi:MAG: diphthine--ammonia ligase [Candidatus Diapherotrites archaeon]
MKLCALFSGGKDSAFAVFQAKKEGHSIECLLTIHSSFTESYMYHRPNIHLTELAAEAMGLPLVTVKTSKGKEDELKPLKEALEKLRDEKGIEGVLTGALASVYQASRIEKICKELGLASVNPLWKKNQKEYLQELIESQFKVMVVGVYAAGLDEKWLGRLLDKKALVELSALEKKFKISVGGEGGELETLVLDCPLFSKKIEILESEKKWDGTRGELVVKKAALREKN